MAPYPVGWPQVVRVLLRAAAVRIAAGLPLALATGLVAARDLDLGGSWFGLALGAKLWGLVAVLQPLAAAAQLWTAASRGYGLRAQLGEAAAATVFAILTTAAVMAVLVLDGWREVAGGLLVCFALSGAALGCSRWRFHARGTDLLRERP